MHTRQVATVTGKIKLSADRRVTGWHRGDGLEPDRHSSPAVSAPPRPPHGDLPCRMRPGALPPCFQPLSVLLSLKGPVHTQGQSSLSVSFSLPTPELRPKDLLILHFLWEALLDHLHVGHPSWYLCPLPVILFLMVSLTLVTAEPRSSGQSWHRAQQAHTLGFEPRSG